MPKVRNTQYYSCMHMAIIDCMNAGCPKVLRCDYGTENSTVATIQIAFRMTHDDSFAGINSFIYGPSTTNIVSYTCTRVIILHIMF